MRAYRSQWWVVYGALCDKMDSTLIDCIQLAEQSVGGYFVNVIAEVKDRQDSKFCEGMFGNTSEGCFGLGGTVTSGEMAETQIQIKLL